MSQDTINCPACSRPMYPLTGIGNGRRCVQCVCGVEGLVQVSPTYSQQRTPGNEGKSLSSIISETT